MSQTWENAHRRGVVSIGTKYSPLLARLPGRVLPNPVGLRGQLTPLGQIRSDAVEPLYPAVGSPLVQPDPMVPAGAWQDPVIPRA